MDQEVYSASPSRYAPYTDRYPKFNNYLGNMKTQIFTSTQSSTSSEERQC